MAINRIRHVDVGETTTVGAVTADYIVQNTGTDMVIPASSNARVIADITLIDTTTGGGGLQTKASISRLGGSTALDIAVPAADSLVNVLLAGATATILTDGSNRIIVRVTGVAAKTIKWMIDVRVNVYTP